jgi:hypothetical protein
VPLSGLTIGTFHWIKCCKMLPLGGKNSLVLGVWRRRVHDSGGGIDSIDDGRCCRSFHFVDGHRAWLLRFGVSRLPGYSLSMKADIHGDGCWHVLTLTDPLRPFQ